MRDLWHAFLQRFFQLLYHQFAWSYDLVAWLVSLGQWKTWSRTTLPYLRGKQVLELGHGPGHLLVTMTRHSFSPIGLDVSPYMTRQARRGLQRADHTVPLVRARAQALPFRTGSFSSVVATFPTQFILQTRTLTEVARTLEQNGRLVVALWVRFQGKDLISRLLRGLYHVTEQNESQPQALRSHLEQAGLMLRIAWEQIGRASILLVIAERA